MKERIIANLSSEMAKWQVGLPAWEAGCVCPQQAECEEGELDVSVDACKHTELRKVHASAQGREWCRACGWVGVGG
jgi:hypothetical protein